MSLILNNKRVAGVGKPGQKGDAFTYEDFTAEQLEGLKGEPGEPGAKGDPGKDAEFPAGSAGQFLGYDTDGTTVVPKNVPVPDVGGQISQHNAASNAHSDIRQAIAGKENSGVAATAVNTHNSDGSAHNDIRQLIANKKGATVYEATIGTSWTENAELGIKTQTVAISGVTADMTAKVDHGRAVTENSDGYALFVDEENQFLDYITNGFAETVAGGIKFTIFGDAPTIAIPIIVEVV